MPKGYTSHKDSWIRKFKGAGKEVRKAGILALSDMAPGISGTARSATDFARESSTFVRKTTSQLNTQYRNLSRNLAGKKMNAVLADAYRDISNGTFSFKDLVGESYDSSDEFESYIDSVDSQKRMTSDPNEIAAAESKRNFAMMGRAITQGNAATLEGLQNVSETIANVTVKTAQSSNLQAQNMNRMQISNMNAGFMTVTNRLDMINTNLVALMDFHRDNTALLHQQTMEFNSQSLQMMSEIGEGMAELRDFMTEQREFLAQQRELSMPTKEKRTFDFTKGFDFSEYKDFVKRNFQASDAGMAANIGLMMFDMMQLGAMGDDTPLHRKALSAGLNFLTPDKMKKTIARFDKSFTSSINEVLYRLGDFDQSDSTIKKFIGQVFGQKRPNIKSPVLSNFKKGVMSWNGIAQQTLVEVIPSYLARIESALTKNPERYYNMDTGKFQSEDKLVKEYQNRFNSQVQFDMSDFTTQFKKFFKDDAQRDQLAELVSANVYSYLLDPRGTSKSKTRQQMLNELYAMAKRNSSMSSKDVHDLLLAFMSGLNNAQTNTLDLSREINSVQRYLWNDETKDTSKYHRRESLLTNRYLTKDGRSLDELSETERAIEEKEERYQRWLENVNNAWSYIDESEFEDDGIFGLKKKIKDAKKRIFKNNTGNGPIINNINRLADIMLDLAIGITGEGDLNLPDRTKLSPIPSSKPASTGSPQGQKSATTVDFRWNKEAQESLIKVIPEHLTRIEKAILNITPSRITELETGQQKVSGQIDNAVDRIRRNTRDLLQTDSTTVQRHAKETNDLIDSLRESAGSATTAISSEQEAITTLANHIEDSDNSVKATMVALNDNVLAPMNSQVFGKEGIIGKITDKDSMKELRDVLFDEETGPLGGMSLWMKDQMKEMNHAITGKAYVKSDGTKVGEDRNSVADHIANGYDFIFKNTMTYLFGDDFRNDDNYQKWASWADLKSKREEKHKTNEGTQQAELLGLRNSQEEIKNQSIIKRFNKDSGEYEWFEVKKGKNGKTLTGKLDYDDTIQLLSEGRDVVDAGNLENTINQSLDVKNGKEPAIDTIRRASAIAGKKIIEKAEKMADYVVGDTDDIEDSQIQNQQKKFQSNFMDKAKKYLPAGVAAAIAGGILGTSVKLHGGGILGGLFLPSGLIPGATAAVGLSMLARNEKFQNVMFGEKDDDGNRVGGLISKKSQDTFKKSLPLIIGASTLGAIKGLFKSAAGLSTVGGPGGFLLNSLLPGGPVGGAILGLGIGLLKNNESFNRILWGEKDDDGKRNGGILSKGSGKFKKVLEDHIPGIKAGLAGLGVGAATGAALSGMGVVGSALSLGGPVGMGLAGLGLGIASQSDKFREYLFGTEEFDKDGNLKGRRGDGLFTRARNALVTNVFDPLKVTIQNNVEDFAFWTKDKLLFPFREAFGPIIDSFHEIKKNVKQTFEDTANKTAKVIEDTAKAMLKPITIPFKKFADVLAKTVKMGAQAALLPATVPLQLIRFGTRNMRKRARGEETKTLWNHAGDIFRGIREQTKNDWENDTRDYGSGIGGWINRKLTRGGDIIRNVRAGIDTAGEAYENELSAQGLNALGYMGVRRERRQMKRQRKELLKDRNKWKNIDAERRALANELNNSEALYSNEGLKGIQKRFEKAGLTGADQLIKTNEDLNRLLYNRSEFRDLLAGKKLKDDRDPIVKKLDDGVGIKVPNDVLKYQEKTSNYQDHVITGLDYIVKEFTKLGAEAAIRKKEKITMKDLIGIDSRLKATGSNWKELDIDVNNVVDKASISKEDFDKYLNEKFKNGEVRDDENGFLNLIEEILRRTDEMVALSEASNNLQEADILAENESTIDALRGIRRGRVDSIARQNKKNKERASKREKEAEESEKARTGHKDNLDETEDRSFPEGEIEGLGKDRTVADKAKSLITGLFGFVGNALTSSKFWIGLGILGLFSDKLKSLAGKVIEVVKPPVTNFVEETIPSILNTAKTAITQYAPSLAKYLVDNVVDNMSFIVDNMVTILGAALGTIGKKIVNGISRKLGFGDKFPEVSNYKARTFNTPEDAQQYAEQNGLTAVGNMVIEEDQIVNEDGTIADISPGRSGVRGVFAREGIQFIRSATNRKLMGLTGKVLAKGSLAMAGAATGGVTGAFLGPIAGWLTKKTVTGTGKLVGKIGKGIINKATSSVTDKIAKDATNEMAKAATTDVAKKKFIKNFIHKVGDKIKGVANAVSKHISGKDLGKFVDDMMVKVIGWLERSDSKLLNKIAEKITKGSAESAAKTAAGVTPLAVILAAYGGISGFLSAAQLFGVDPSDVDLPMRSAASLMGALLSTSAGTWIDLLLEVINLLTGGKVNVKQLFARWLYKTMVGEDKMQEAIDRMEAETEKYNKMNNTNLTPEAFNELTNGNLTIFGRAKKTWERLTLSDEKWNKKYNFTQYRVNDDELKTYQQNKYSGGAVGVSTVGNGLGNQNLAVGYGPFLQSDPRWAKYPIGRFPDGTVSTMATGGCGPTALSMVANSASPAGIAQYAKKKGYIKDGGATADLFTKGAADFGLHADTLNRSNVKNALAQGKSVIMSGKSSMSGPYTEAGHVIAVNGIGSGDKAIVNDPMRGDSIVNTTDLLTGMTHGWSYTRSAGYGPIVQQLKKKDNENLVELSDLASVTSGKSNISLVDYARENGLDATKKPTSNNLLSGVSVKPVQASVNTLSTATVSNSGVISAPTLVSQDQRSNKKSSGGDNLVWSTGKLKTTYALDKKIKSGYQKINDIYNFNTPQFYKGLNVSDISAMANRKPDLLTDGNVFRFRMIYSYISSAPFSKDHTLTVNEIGLAFGETGFINSLGGEGVAGQYEFKYGFPFFQTDDPRWAPLPWGGANVSSRGSDLSSLAAVATAFSPNMIDPLYINDKWISEAPQWMGTDGRLNMERVFANDADGFNAMKSSQINGERLRVQKLDNIPSMISSLKQKKPIVMTGYRYKGGIFGGYYNKNNAPINGADDYSTVVARAADDTHIAIIDPFSTLRQNTIYKTDSLYDKIDGKSIIKSAYMVTDPSGNGIPGVVDLSSKHGITDYTSIKDAKGLDKITALFTNILNIGKHVLDSAVNGDYRSIFSINEIEDDGFDDAALEYTNASKEGKEKTETNTTDKTTGNNERKVHYRVIKDDAGNITTVEDSTPAAQVGDSGAFKYATDIGGSTIHTSKSNEDHGGKGGYFGIGSGFRDLVFGPAGASFENPQEGSAALANATSRGDNFDIIQKTGSQHLTSSPNRSIKYLIEHYTTDVSSEKGKARNTAAYFNTSSAGGSADFIVDDEEFVQYNPDPLNMYTHAVGGDKLTPTTSLGGILHGTATNANSVSIEITSSKRDKSDRSRATDDDWYFTDAAENNAAKLTRYLMKQYNIPKENVIMHHHVTGKLCPAMWTNKEGDLQGWYNFQRKLSGDFNGVVTNGVTSVNSDGSTTMTISNGDNISATNPTMTNEEMWNKLSFTQKFKAIISANQAAMFGDDYETAKWESARSMLGLSTDDTSSASTSSLSINGAGSSNQQETAGYISSVLKSNGFSNTAIGGILSNFNAEGGIDATAVEGIYNEPYQIGSKKSSALSDLNSYTLNTLFPYYDAHGPHVSKNAYLSNSKYFPGIGLGQWTGPRAEMLINYATQKGRSWYDPALQTDFMLNGDSSDRINILNSYKQASESMTPTEAAKWFENKWEGSTHAEAKHQATADAWAQFASTASINTASSNVTGGNGSWLDTCAKVKAAIALQRPGYSQSQYITITVDGVKQSVRTDCSGYVSACVRYYTGTNFAENTTGLMKSTNNILESHGFKYMAWPGYDGLVPGDIMVNSSHTEIFAGNENGVHKVYNCGSDASVNTPGTTNGSKTYTCIWRPSNAGSLSANLNTAASNTNTNESSYSTISNMMHEVAGFGPGPKGSPQEFFETTLGGITTSKYGQRSTVLGNEYHRGLDISAPEGQDIISPVDGTIVTSGYDAAGYGNYAVVKDADGNHHVFAHMKGLVGYGNGAKVSRNDVIGKVGSTGNATGDHLHYEIRKNGSKYSTINPNTFRYGNDLSIHSAHSNMQPDPEPIGSGNRDFSKEIQEKLNVALNTESIEDKMDSIIEVLGTMAKGINNMNTPVPSTTTTNNTVVYGDGKQRRKTVITRNDGASIPKRDNITLLSQHHMEIAKF